MSKLPITEAFREWARTATKAEKDKFISEANAIAKGLQVVPARLTKVEIAQRRQYLLDLRAKLGVPKKVNTASGDINASITDKKVRVPKGVAGPFRLSRKDWRKAKTTGDWVGDAALQHQKDQEELRKAEKKTQEAAKKAARNARRVQARLEAKKPRYVKQDFLVTQKRLVAQWAFPVSRLEEFLSLFQNAAYNVAAERMAGATPVENPPGEKHSMEARRLAAAVSDAALSVQFGFRTTPDYCEVDYFFWIVSGWVCFGCVLPSSEKIEAYNLNIPWVKMPSEIVIGKYQRLSGNCLEGSIPTYVKMLSFKPGEMIGVQEFAKRLVPNPKEREWAIRYALRVRIDKIRDDRRKLLEIGQQMVDERSGGAGMIARERVRQIKEEGFDAARDDSYTKGELAWAATCYASPWNESKRGIPGTWPKTWDKSWWKPSDDAIVNLTKAGGLIAAEIDRILRLKTNIRCRPSPAKIMSDIIRKNMTGV